MFIKNFYKKEYYSVFTFDYLILLALIATTISVILLVFFQSKLLLVTTILLLGLWTLYFLVQIFNFKIKIEYLHLDSKNQKIIEGKAKAKPQYRIIFITDLHLHDFLSYKFISNYIAKINDLNPDLLLFGGDFIIDDKTKFNNLDVLADLGEYRKIAVLGNHDYNLRSNGIDTIPKEGQKIADKVTEILNSHGIEVLVNENKSLNLPDKTELNIFGAGIYWANGIDFSKFEAKDLNIAISHHPEIFPKLKDKNIDLVLSGHNHGGGQVKLNKYISIHRLLMFFSKHWRRDFAWYVSGLYKNSNGLKMYLSRGLGITGISMRINCPMEITVIDVV